MKNTRHVSLLLLFFHLFLYRPSAQTWSQKANVGGLARNAPVSFAIGDFGYIGTGIAGSTMLNDVWKYDPTTNTWTQVADFPGSGRFGAVGFAIAQKGYCGLGSSGYPVYNFVTDFYEYDPGSNQWTQLGDFPGPGRYTASSFVIGDKAYAGCGWSPLTNDFWEYNPLTDTWNQRSDFPGTARQSATAFALNGMGYLGMGNDGSSLNDLWEYDPGTDSWTQRADFPGTPRYGSVAFALGNHAYVGSGGDGTSFFNNFYKYDPATNNWSAISNYPGPGSRHSPSFTIGTCAYFGAGITSSGNTTTFWSLCDSSLIGINDIETRTANFQVYTTENNNALIIESRYYENKRVNIKVSDVCGKSLLDIFENTGEGYRYKLDLSGYARGAYIVHLGVDGGVQSYKFIKS
jgi:N-acetylneuraminic acid mutarotase